MARVHIRPRRDVPGGWQVEIPARHSPTGKRSIRSFSGPDAEARARVWRDELEESIWRKKAGLDAEICVSEICQEWISGPWGLALKPSTRKTAESAIRRHIDPAFGSVFLADLDQDLMLRFITEKLNAGLSVHHVRTIVNILGRAVRLRCQRDRIPFPLAGNLGSILSSAASAREVEVPEPPWWEIDELEKLRSLAARDREWFGALIRVASDTALRRGEILGLQVADLNFSRGEIRVRRAIVDGVQVSTKNRRSRSVLMVPALAEILRSHLEPRSFVQNESTWVFQGNDKGPVSLAELRRHWERLRRRASALGVRPYKFHAFRHSWITHAIANREPIPWVSAQAGHSSASFTLRVYAHAVPQVTRELAWLEQERA